MYNAMRPAPRISIIFMLGYMQGMWAKTLGFGDFYYELGVQAVEACLASRSANGGMLELGALTRAVNKRRGSAADPVTTDDLVS